MSSEIETALAAGVMGLEKDLLHLKDGLHIISVKPGLLVMGLGKDPLN